MSEPPTANGKHYSSNEFLLFMVTIIDVIISISVRDRSVLLFCVA